MAFRTLALVLAASFAAGLLIPAAGSAQSGPTALQSYSGQGYGYAADRPRDRNAYPRTGPGRDGYARDAVYEDKPPSRRPADRERREQCDRASAGSLLGAIAGGLLGDSASGGRGGRSGPLRGHDADRDCD